jgi:hypothetical protein
MTNPIDAVLQFLKDRKSSYQQTFSLNQPAHVVVLEDLARFCRAEETCVVPGDRDKSLVLEGRREVWLRIQQHLQFPPEVLFSLYNGGKTPNKG